MPATERKGDSMTRAGPAIARMARSHTDPDAVKQSVAAQTLVKAGHACDPGEDALVGAAMPATGARSDP